MLCKCWLLYLCSHHGWSPQLGGHPSAWFPRGHVPCGAGEAVVLLICAFPIQGRTGQEYAKQFPQCGFSAQISLPSASRKGVFVWLFCYGSARPCVGAWDGLAGQPQQSEGPHQHPHQGLGFF